MLFFQHLNLKNFIEFYSIKIVKHSNLVNKLKKIVNETK